MNDRAKHNSTLAEHVGEIKRQLRSDFIKSGYTRGLEYGVHIGNSEDSQWSDKGKRYCELRKDAIDFLLKSGLITKLVRQDEAQDWMDVVDGKRRYERNFGEDEYLQIITINWIKLFSLREVVLYGVAILVIVLVPILHILKAIK